MKKQPAKVSKVMKEYKTGTLHSGKKGPVVKNLKQAVAIALSEAGMSKKKMHRMPNGKMMEGAKHEKNESAKTKMKEKKSGKS